MFLVLLRFLSFLGKELEVLLLGFGRKIVAAIQRVDVSRIQFVFGI
jgi:hypothetical protein